MHYHGGLILNRQLSKLYCVDYKRSTRGREQQSDSLRRDSALYADLLMFRPSSKIAILHEARLDESTNQSQNMQGVEFKHQGFAR